MLLFIAGFFALASVVLLFVYRSAKAQDIDGAEVALIFLVGTCLVTIAAFGWASAFTVQTGHVGVVSWFGEVDANQLPLGEGLHFLNPLKDVIQVDCKTVEYKEVVESQSSEGMAMRIEGSVQYRIVGSEAPFMLKHIGTEHGQKVIRPAIRSAVRASTPNFGAVQQMTVDREALSILINEQLQVELEQLFHSQYPEYKGLPIVARFTLRDVAAPPSVNESINRKLEAEQEAEREDHAIARERKVKTWELEKERIEAQRKAVEAEGIAEFQRIVSEGISDKLIHWKWLDAMKSLAGSENTTFIFAPDGRELPIRPVMELGK